MRRLIVAALLALVAWAPARAVDLSPITNAMAASPTAWTQLSANTFISQQPAVADKNSTGFESTASVTGAWSSVAWDSLRGQLVLGLGGGHGNYSGNESYLWQAATLSWARASLPSKVVAVNVSGSNVFMPVDGASNAPGSAHTYDGQVYLPVMDRVLVLPGPTFNWAGGPVHPDGSAAGPYLWNPALADPSKVGGTTGSAVNPAVIGGQMWTNLNVPQTITGWFGTVGLNGVDRVSAAAVVGGVDHVYYTGVAAGNQWLMDYVPSTGALTALAANGSSQAIYGSAGLDPARNWFVGPNQAGTGFAGYDITAGVGFDITLAGGGPSFSSLLTAGVDFLGVADAFMVWDGAGKVLKLTAPASGVRADAWTLALVTDGTGGPIPAGMNVSGVRGKFVCIDDIGGCLGIDGDANGMVWAVSVIPVPEPGTAAMWAAGLAVVGWIGRRRLAANDERMQRSA